MAASWRANAPVLLSGATWATKTWWGELRRRPADRRRINQRSCHIQHCSVLQMSLHRQPPDSCFIPSYLAGNVIAEHHLEEGLLR